MAHFDIKGLEALSDNEKEEVSRILESSYEKIKRKTKVDFFLKLMIKAHSKVDKKERRNKDKKYGIRANISGTLRQFDASADDWDLHKAVHKVMQKLENEVEHVFHSSEQHA